MCNGCSGTLTPLSGFGCCFSGVALRAGTGPLSLSRLFPGESYVSPMPNRFGSNVRMAGIISLCFGCFAWGSIEAHASPPPASGPSTVVTGLSYPQAIAVDHNGNLYIGDQGCVNFIGAPGDCNVYKEALSNGTYTQTLKASSPVSALRMLHKASLLTAAATYSSRFWETASFRRRRREQVNIPKRRSVVRLIRQGALR